MVRILRAELENYGSARICPWRIRSPLEAGDPGLQRWALPCRPRQASGGRQGPEVGLWHGRCESFSVGSHLPRLAPERERSMAGTKDKLAGKAMQAEGKATGDPIRQAEGKAVSMRGELKDRASKLKPQNLGKGTRKP